MSTRDRERWDEKYANTAAPAVVLPDQWLVECVRSIELDAMRSAPARRALDIACGLGQNAIWLAQQGWHVHAVDISSRALQLAGECAHAEGVEVDWIEADLDHWVPTESHYQLVIVFRYLDRVTVPRVVRKALCPGGWLVFETFSAAQCARPDNHIKNPAYTLAPGELVNLFPEFDPIELREDCLRDRTVERFRARRM